MSLLSGRGCGSGRGEHHEQRDDALARDRVAAPSGGLQPPGSDELAQVVVELPGGPDHLERLELRDGAPAPEHGLQQQDPHAVAQRGERRSEVVGVRAQQRGHPFALLPDVALPGRQRRAAREDHRARAGVVAQARLEPLQGPEVLGGGSRRVRDGCGRRLECLQSALDGGETLVEIGHHR